MNDLLWVIQLANNYLLSIYYMPGTMYPEDTVVNLKHSFPCEAYILMRETNSNKINKVENGPE